LGWLWRSQISFNQKVRRQKQSARMRLESGFKWGGLSVGFTATIILRGEDGNKNDRVKNKTHLRYLDQMLSVVWKLQDKLH